MPGNTQLRTAGAGPPVQPTQAYDGSVQSLGNIRAAVRAILLLSADLPVAIHRLARSSGAVIVLVP